MSPPQIKTDIQIVPFVQSDQAGVLEVILPIQREEFAIPITAEDQPDLLAIADFYQTGTGGFWVAKADGHVVGTIGLKDIGNRKAALRKMFVATGYRGSPPGTASKLLTTALTAAESRGIATIFLGTTDKFVGPTGSTRRTGLPRSNGTSFRIRSLLWPSIPSSLRSACPGVMRVDHRQWIGGAR